MTYQAQMRAMEVHVVELLLTACALKGSVVILRHAPYDTLCDTLGGCLSSFYTTPQTAGTVHEAACQHRTATLGGASWCSVFEPVLGSHTGLSKMHRRRIMATLCVGIAASDIMPLLMKILQRSMAFDISGPDACNGGACRRAVTYCLCF